MSLDSAARRFSVATAAAIALGLIVLALSAGVVAIGLDAHRLNVADATAQGPIILSFAIVGFVVALRQPNNAIGWVLLSASFFFIVDDIASAYSVLDYGLNGGRLPLGALAVIVQPSWAPAIVLFGLAILLFPDAKVPSRAWRWVVWVFLAIAALWVLGAFALASDAVVQHKIQIDSTGNLILLDHPTGNWAWWGVAQNIFFPILGLGWLSSLARQVGAYRGSTGDRRLQLKWLMAGASTCVIGGFFSVVFSSSSSETLRVLSSIGTLGLVGLPLSIGVAILKYRLYDIDRLISRTLSYALVTGLLVGIYVGIVVLTTDVLSFSSPVAVTASTLVAAALFNPLRRGVQRLVDRRFNRRGYNADQTIADFSLQLRASVDLDTVRADLLEAVGRSVEPAHMGVWIRQRPAS
jgi:hypothetical protein